MEAHRQHISDQLQATGLTREFLDEALGASSMNAESAGGFRRRAEEIIAGELSVAPELVPIFETLIKARRDILERIAVLGGQIRAAARRHSTVRLLMSAPGVGPITAMAVVSTFDDAARFKRSSSAGAYLGLTPKRCEPGEVSRNGRSRSAATSLQGDALRGSERNILPQARWPTAV